MTGDWRDMQRAGIERARAEGRYVHRRPRGKKTPGGPERAAELRAGGKTNEEIAKELGVSGRTVSRYLCGVTGSAGVRNSDSGQTVLLGDCLDVMATMEPGSVSCVVTSPPYPGDRPWHDRRPDYLRWIGEVYRAIDRVLRPDGHVFLVLGSSRARPWSAYLAARRASRVWRLQNEIAWTFSVEIDGRRRGQFTPNNSRRHLDQVWETVFHFTRSGRVPLSGDGIDHWHVPYETIHSREERAGHRAIFPVELAERCIRLAGVGPETCVLDPFVGTGSTLVAARRLGVAAWGIEKEARYVAVAKSRLDGALSDPASAALPPPA